MKKLLYAAIAAIGLLLSPACSNEDELSNDNEALVSFNVGVENGMQTKTIADGSTATVLRVRVFEDGTTEGTIKELTAFQQDFTNFDGQKENIQFSLLKGKKYYFLFWAEATTSPYAIGTDGTITVNYTGAKCNDETRDAFVGVYSCEAQTTITETVTLKRPFAQLNFLTTEKDIQAAAAGKIVNDIVTTPLKTKVIINNAAITYNPFTKKVNGSTNATFEMKEALFTVIKNGTGTAASNYGVSAEKGAVTISGNTYHYLASVYFLVNTGDSQDATKQTTLSSATLEVDGTAYTPLEVNNPNVQQNYRTNIYGDLLTKQGQFTVSISAGFDNTENREQIVSITKEVSDYTAFAAALADNTVNKIVLTEDINLESLDPGTKITINRDLTIDGTATNNRTNYGFIGRARAIELASSGNYTVSFVNVDFVNGDDPAALHASAFSGKLTVNNCVFWGGNTNNVGFLNDGIVIEGLANNAEVEITNSKFYGRDQSSSLRIKEPAKGQFIIIKGASGGCTAQVTITNNEFSDPNETMGGDGTISTDPVKPGEGGASQTSVAGTYISLLNLSPNYTAVGKNTIESRSTSYLTATGIKTTFTGINSDDFFRYFTGNEIKTVTGHEGDD